MTPPGAVSAKSLPGTIPGAASHHIPAEEVCRLLGVDPIQGLTSTEVEARRKQFGWNRLSPPRRRPGWLRFLGQLHQPLVYILLIAGIVTGLLREWVDCSVIFLVIIVNAIVGFVQEERAGRAIESLSRLVRTRARVRREGEDAQLDADELVPGDIVRLEAGDRVPADLRLWQVRDLRIDESMLTGESLPAAKGADTLARDTVLADRSNLAFTGSLVTAGTGTGIVWATGDQTETGHIARLINQVTELSTPLTRKIAEFSRLLLWAIVALAAVTFGIGMLRGEPPEQTFMAAVALAVGAIPEGLPAAVTVVLAIGVARMARRQAVIRRMPAVETLGSTTVICSDKTGTLTENQMTVREVFAGGEYFEFTGTGYDPTGEVRRSGQAVLPTEHPALNECLLAAAVCNDARLIYRVDQWKTEGDPTEAALLVAAEKGGLSTGQAREAAPRVDSIPFASEHMFRATLHDTGEGRVIYKVGAAERLLDRCDHQLNASGELAAFDRPAAESALEEMTDRGLRVLAVARRGVPPGHERLEHKHVVGGLTFLGLEGMLDPPRTEAVAAVRRCREAGIEVKMITGDHLATAAAIARQIGLSDSPDPPSLTGRELAEVAEAKLPDVAARTSIFARVAPEQKLRLVEALQARGQIVAMTGDGVNDAPALRRADIGIAMGRSGTDVAKGAADMVLTDDNFASIEAAVEEGRGIFDNLTKFIVWTLPTNAGEGLLLLIAIGLGLQLPVLPVQLLWINMSTAILLGLMLVFEPKEGDLMQRPPRDPRRPLLTLPLIMRTGLVALMMLGGAYWLFFFELNNPSTPLAAARTAVINVIVFVEMAYLFNCRSLHRTLLRPGHASNPWAIWGALGMGAAQLLITYAPPMNRLFHTYPLPPDTWVRILGVALLAFLVVELEKFVRFHRHPHRPPE